jgi:hypothetical protein
VPAEGAPSDPDATSVRSTAARGIGLNALVFPGLSPAIRPARSPSPSYRGVTRR